MKERWRESVALFEGEGGRLGKWASEFISRLPFSVFETFTSSNFLYLDLFR